MIYFLPTDTCFWIACELINSDDYNKIYDIKKRDLKKPLAIMVENFEWLKKYTTLNEKQVNFLKTYKNPFTILTNCDYIAYILNYEDDKISFINKNIYKKIAFRVAHNDIQKKLTKKLWPIFLTSANIADKSEIYSREILQKEFQYYIDKWIVKILWPWDSQKKSISSDIFEFKWESLNIEYLRKI
jgi:L-threonylcarbamoyladenylate synthase